MILCGHSYGGMVITGVADRMPAGTEAGMILGTAAYMSPEQAKGRAADKRSDVWAFGCVLYEMLSGQRAFKGDDVADTLSLVLRGDADLEQLPASVPPSIRELIRGCLRRNTCGRPEGCPTRRARPYRGGNRRWHWRW